jgi:phosphotransferase system  glucose/maltose/N-acetylglucosamine-specific IIC component
MRYIEPTRVKVLMMMFFATGSIGIVIGLSPVAGPQQTLMITFLGVINIGLGAFFTFLFLTQTQKDPDKRKKKRKSDKNN